MFYKTFKYQHILTLGKSTCNAPFFHTAVNKKNLLSQATSSVGVDGFEPPTLCL